MRVMIGEPLKIMFDGVEIGDIHDVELLDSKRVKPKITPKLSTLKAKFKASPSFYEWFTDLKFTSMLYWSNVRREKRLNAFWSRYC